MQWTVDTVEGYKGGIKGFFVGLSEWEERCGVVFEMMNCIAMRRAGEKIKYY
jgi:hypothetical protein